MKTFKEAKAEDISEDIDDWIENWHLSDDPELDGISLQDYLGLTDEEYKTTGIEFPDWTK